MEYIDNYGKHAARYLPLALAGAGEGVGRGDWSGKNFFGILKISC